MSRADRRSCGGLTIGRVRGFAARKTDCEITASLYGSQQGRRESDYHIELGLAVL